MARHLQRRQFLRILGAGATVSLLSACGPSASAPAAPPKAAAPTVAPQAAAPAAPAKAAAPASSGAPPAASAPVRERLTIGLSTEAGSLDSTTLTTTESRLLFGNIYDPLIHRDGAGKLVPRLAEKWEQIDDTTLRLTLRKNVKFHNGEDFNAEAVRFTLERYADPKSQAATRTTSIKEVRVVDDSTVEFISKAPDPLLLGIIADGFFIVPPKFYQDKGAATVAAQPVGTGPFVFKEWIKGDRLDLTVNNDYWGGKPTAQNLTFRFIPEAGTRVAGLQNGELDIVNDLPPALARELQANDQITLSTANDPAIVHVGLKVNDEILKDKRVRQALNYATNKDAIIQRLLFGYATAAGQVAMPGSFGHNPNVKPVPYDPEKAKELLAEAGHPNGFEIVMGAPIGYVAHGKELAEAIIGDWAKVGVKVNLIMTEWATFNRDHLLSKDGAGLEPTFIMLKRYPSLDAGETMRTAFPTGAQWNYNQYSNPQADEYIRIQASTINEQQRTDALMKLAELLADDAPYVWLYWSHLLHGARKGVNYQVRSDGLIHARDDVTFG